MMLQILVQAQEIDGEATVKIVTIVFLLVVSITLGVLPVKWERVRDNPKLVGFANTFAAGLFLGVGLFHILPESVSDYQKYRQERSLETTNNPEAYFPLPFFVAACSYCFILFIDKVAFQSHDILESHAHPLPEAEVDAEAQEDQSEGIKVNAIRSEGAGGAILQEAENQKNRSLLARSIGKDEHTSVSEHYDKDEDAFKNLLSSTMRIGRQFGVYLTFFSREVTFINGWSRQKANRGRRDPKFIVNHLIATIINLLNQRDSQNKIDQPKKLETTGVEPYILLAALSLHAVFEGIAIGLGKDVGPTINLAAAVAIHKWAEALALGVSLLKAEASNRIIYTMVTIFSVASPLGICLGWVLLDASLVWSAVFKAVAAGTFIYLSATEIAVEEFSITKNRFSKFVCYMVGLTLVAVATYYES